MPLFHPRCVSELNSRLDSSEWQSIIASPEESEAAATKEAAMMCVRFGRKLLVSVVLLACAQAASAVTVGLDKASQG
jgi:hypothetical protein